MSLSLMIQLSTYYKRKRIFLANKLEEIHERISQLFIVKLKRNLDDIYNLQIGIPLDK